jgi:hypothetical protein
MQKPPIVHKTCIVEIFHSPGFKLIRSQTTVMKTVLRDRTKITWHKLIASLCLIIVTSSLVSSTGFSQERSYEARRQFYAVENLIKIIEQARAAGMSDEEIQKMTIPVDGRDKSIVDYLAELERLRALKNKELEDFLSKKFLTINDIFNELIISEPKVIQKLREELVSDR